MMEKICCLFNQIMREGSQGTTPKGPNYWAESKITLLHKGGYKNRKELRNYRPSALMKTLGKIFCTVIKQRMEGLIKDNGVLGEEQSGFRRRRRGTDNIFILGKVIDKAKKMKKEVYIAFLTIEKAYDRVDSKIMWRVLKRVGFEENLVRVIESRYESTRAKISLGGGMFGVDI